MAGHQSAGCEQLLHASLCFGVDVYMYAFVCICMYKYAYVYVYVCIQIHIYTTGSLLCRAITGKFIHLLAWKNNKNNFFQWHSGHKFGRCKRGWVWEKDCEDSCKYLRSTHFWFTSCSPFLIFSTLFARNCFLIFRWNHCCTNLYPLLPLLSTLKRASLHLLCILPSGINRHWWDLPQSHLFSRLNTLTTLILSSEEQCYKTFIIFASLYWGTTELFPGIFRFLLYCGAHN